MSAPISLSKVGFGILTQLQVKEQITEFTKIIKKLGDAFSNLPEPMQKFIIWGGLILTVLGPALIVIGQLVIGFSVMIIVLSKTSLAIAAFVTLIKTAFIPVLIRMIVAIKSFGVALLTTPVGWFILAVSAIAGAAFLVWKNWDKFKTFFIDMWVKIKNVVKTTINSMMPIIEKFTGAIDSVVGGVKSVKSFVFGGDEKKAGSFAPAVGTNLGRNLARQQVDTGGTLHIKIDQDNQVRVLQAESNDGRQNINVDTGLLMGGL